MKGIELPINILVIVAVAVIVLLGVIALFFGGWAGPAGAMTQQAAKEKYCAIILRAPGGCTVGNKYLNTVGIADFDADRDGAMDSGTAGTTWCWAAGSPPGCAAVSACANIAAGATERDNLASLLACYYAITTEADGLRSCGCA